MLTDMLVGSTVYVVTGYTDMRKSIDGLAQIIEGKLHDAQAVYLRFTGCSELSQASSMNLQPAAAAGTADFLYLHKNTYAALE